MPESVAGEPLKECLQAFNCHDLDAIMGYFVVDCVFYMPRGSAPRGERHLGKEQLRAGLAKRFEGIPDVRYGEDRRWVCGDFGVSEWTLTGTSVSTSKLKVRSIDLLAFVDGKIIRKDPFWKILEYLGTDSRAADIWGQGKNY